MPQAVAAQAPEAAIRDESDWQPQASPAPTMGTRPISPSHSAPGAIRRVASGSPMAMAIPETARKAHATRIQPSVARDGRRIQSATNRPTAAATAG